MSAEDASLRAALNSIPLLQELDPATLEIQRLSGLSNRNYRLRTDTQDYVLRLPGAGSARFIDRASKRDNQVLAARLGLTPAVLYDDPVSGVQLSAYLAGRSLSADDLQDPQQLAEAVALLRWLHQSDAVFQGRWPIFETLADYLHWVGPHWSAGFAALSRDLQALRPELENKAWPFCACHCDPNPANFYKAGRLWLLDWEYSAWAEPAWDLAGLVAEAGLDSARQRQLLRYYLGRDDADLQRRIALYLPCLHTLAAAWGAAQIGLGNHTAKDSAAYVDKRLALARQQLQSLSFG